MTLNDTNAADRTSLTAAELAELAHYETAPEQASPNFTYFDEAAKQSQKKWRWLFLWSVFLLLGISFFSAITGLGAWLVAKHYLKPTQTRLIDEWGIALTLLGVVAEVGIQFYWRQRLSPWAFTRARAEALRSAVWLYLFGLPLFRATRRPPATGSSTARWQYLLQDLAGEMQRHSAATGRPLAPLPASHNEPTPELQQWQQRLGELSFAEKLRAYCVARLATQRTYFLKRTRELHQEATRWTRISYGVFGVAVAWNLVRLYYLVQNDTEAMLFFNFNFFLVLIGGVGLIKAYLGAEDMEALAVRYHHMADRLAERETEQPPAPVSAEAFRHFITESELLLRDETTEWTTRRGEPTPAAPQTVTIGFVGKRKLPGGEAPLRATLAAILDQLEQEFPGPAHELVGLSALALGADMVFVELMSARGIQVPRAGQPGYAQRIVLPTQPATFFAPADFRLTETEPEAAVRERLARADALAHAPSVREVRVVGTSPDRNEQFAEAAFAIADGCDLLLVACTQADRAAALAQPLTNDLAQGGSAETLQYAHTHGKRLIIIEVDAPTGPAGTLRTTTLPARS